jgi:hypothetical protein
MFGRRFADLLLFCVTSAELVILFLLTPTFTITDWIYVLQHFIVLVIALTRRRPKVWDYSIASSMAVGISYVYPYAQVIYLRWSPGHVAWPAAGLVLVTLAASLSLVSLLAMGRLFRVRPVRGQVTVGLRFIRNPMAFTCLQTSVQPTGMEFRHALPGVGRLGVSGLRIRQEQLSTCRMAAYIVLVRYRLFPFLVKAPLAYCWSTVSDHLFAADRHGRPTRCGTLGD